MSAVSSRQLEARNQKLETLLVGREAELRQLHNWLVKALSGERQIVFVTGEPGIGKTTVVEAFLSQLETRDGGLGASPWIGRGQCIEHYGTGEAYLPLLEALGRLGRESGGQRLIELLSQQAPTWLVQMPALLTRARAGDAPAEDSGRDPRAHAARVGRSGREAGGRATFSAVAGRPALG